MTVLPGPVLPWSRAIVGVIVVSILTSVLVTYASNRVDSVKKLIGPK